MKHQGTKQIETERLLLRKLSVNDAKNMYDNWASDDEVTKFLTWPTYKSVDGAIETLSNWSKEYENDDYYQWGIELKSINEVIGSISVVEMDEKIEMAEIGYCIGKKWWHQGITSEALSALIDFLFNEVGVNRIQAKHDINNPHSGLVMKKCGMKLEGINKSAGLNNQGICDTAIYAILKNEYIKKP